MPYNLQIDIFGNETPVEEAYAEKPRETIKSRYRRMYGYDHEHKCGECRHCEAHFRDRTYYKCRLIGISASDATDIRLKDPACTRFEKC